VTGKYAEPFREKYTEYVKLLIEINVLVNGRMTPAIAFGRAAEKYVKQNFGKASLEFAGYGIHMEAILNVNEKKLAYAKSDDPKVSKKAMAMATKKEAYTTTDETVNYAYSKALGHVVESSFFEDLYDGNGAALAAIAALRSNAAKRGGRIYEAVWGPDGSMRPGGKGYKKHQAAMKKSWGVGGALRLASERNWAVGGAARLASERRNADNWAEDGVLRNMYKAGGTMAEGGEGRKNQLAGTADAYAAGGTMAEGGEGRANQLAGMDARSAAKAAKRASALEAGLKGPINREAWRKLEKVVQAAKNACSYSRNSRKSESQVEALCKAYQAQRAALKAAGERLGFGLSKEL